MANQKISNPFIPVALTFGYYPDFGFLVLPYDTLFACEVMRKKAPSYCIMSADNIEHAQKLFAERRGEISIADRATIVPFALNELLRFSEKYHNNTTIFAAETLHNGLPCQPYAIARPLKEFSFDTRVIAKNENRGMGALQDDLLEMHQQTLFGTLVHQYMGEMPYRYPRLNHDEPIGVDELLMLAGNKWWHEDDNPLPKSYEITLGTLNKRGPVRIADVFDYPVQHGSISRKPWVEPR